MTLLKRLQRLAWRHMAIQVAAGAAWGVVGAAAMLVAGAWLDLLWETPPWARVAVMWLAPLTLVLCLGIIAAMALRAAQARQLARRLDAAANSNGQILTGVELALASPANESLTARLADLAVAKAADLAERAPGSRALPWRPAWQGLSALGLVALGIIGLGIAAPRLFRSQWLRFTDPFGEHAPFARLQIHVEPGDVSL